ncbi:MATE family efflux transporter [Nitratireductor basaltis]|uniref:MATE efflux family protein n=1 Tax=Nitratireductor basaltis TaxID=472175 RepID=A0A084UE00_9HYPH|nr:MATE family efflux transporter [Nitratireductor basaltis]KFB11186.1 MATE efflux family protein [Nitratireductor basaltis]
MVTNRQVLAIAVPMTLAYLTTPLLGLVDTAIVGQFGDAALLGGLAAGAIVFDVVFNTLNSLRSGTTGLVAQAFGRGDTREEQATLLRALILAVTAGLLLILASPAIAAAGAWFISPEQAVIDAMHAYIAIRMLAAPMTLINFTLLGYVLGRGEGTLGLGLQFLLNGANISLSLWLGLHLGWGIEGVAWGTVGGESIAAIVGLAIVSRRMRGDRRPARRDVFDLASILRLLSLNGDIMVRSFTLLAAYALFTRQGAQYGTVTLAANAVLLNFILFAGYFLDGFATAAEQLAGRAVGGRNRTAFSRVLLLTGIWGFALAIAATALTIAFGQDLVHLLTTSPDVRALALTYLPFAAFVAISGVLAFQMDGVFIGATWSRDMRNMMLLSLGFYVVALFVLGEAFGNAGLWAAMHIWLIVRGLSLAAILPHRMRQNFA